MGVKIIDAEAPVPREEKNLVRVYKAVPMIPREEAMRLRRAARNAVDSMLPWLVQEMAENAHNCEDPGIKHKILMDLVKISLSGKSNEEADPDAPTVDGTVLEKELKALEKSTENTGTDTE